MNRIAGNALRIICHRIAILHREVGQYPILIADLTRRHDRILARWPNTYSA